MLPDRMPDINLLPYKERRKSSLLYKAFLSVLALVVLLSCLMIFLYFKSKNDLDTTNQKAAELETQRLALETSLNKAKANQEDPFITAAKFADERRLPASTMLAGLIGALPENSYLSEFDYNLGKVEIVSEFETMKKASDYMAALEKLSYISKARVENVESFVLKNEEIPETGGAASRYNVLPRYKVTYSFVINSAALEAEKEKEAEKSE